MKNKIKSLFDLNRKFPSNLKIIIFFTLRKCDTTSVLAVRDVVHHSPTESSRERSVNCYHAHLASVHNVCSYYLDRCLPNPHQVYMVPGTGLDGYRENRKPFTGEKHYVQDYLTSHVLLTWCKCGHLKSTVYRLGLSRD